MQLFLISNGECLHGNPNNYCSVKGLRQAQSIGFHLRDKNFHDFVKLSNPLISCLQTATAISGILEEEFRVDCSISSTVADMHVYNSSTIYPSLDWRSFPKGNYIICAKDLGTHISEFSKLVKSRNVIAVSNAKFIKAYLQSQFKQEYDIPEGSLTLIEDDQVVYVGKTLFSV